MCVFFPQEEEEGKTEMIHSEFDTFDNRSVITPFAKRRLGSQQSTFLTKFELAKCVSKRAAEISQGVHYSYSIVPTLKRLESGVLTTSPYLTQQEGDEEGGGIGGDGRAPSSRRHRRRGGATSSDDDEDDGTSAMKSSTGKRSRQFAATAAVEGRDLEATADGGDDSLPCRSISPKDLLKALPLSIVAAIAPSLVGSSSAYGGVASSSSLMPYGSENGSDPVFLAKWEVSLQLIPYVIHRTYPDGYVDSIPLKELKVDSFWLNLSV